MNKTRQAADKAWQAGRRNLIINGDFDIWQRGTSGSFDYVADRWMHAADGSGGTFSFSRQDFTAGQTDVPNEPTHFARVECTVATTGGSYNAILQRMENVRTAAGKTVTVSLWVKGGSGGETFRVQPSQRFGTGGSPSSSVFLGSIDITLTTSWQKYEATWNVPSISGKTLGTNNDHSFEVALHGPVNAVAYYDIAQVQVEIGDYATDFEQRHIGEELALCQRYYERNDSPTSGLIYQADITTGKEYNLTVRFAVKKRGTPTITVSSAGESSVFSSARASNAIRSDEFEVKATSILTAPNGWFRSSWIADAEL